MAKKTKAKSAGKAAAAKSAGKAVAKSAGKAMSKSAGKFVAKSAGTVDMAEIYHMLPQADYDEWVNPEHDKAVAALHSVLRKSDGDHRAVAASELGVFKKSYPVVGEATAKRIICVLAVLREPAKKKKLAQASVIDIEDESQEDAENELLDDAG